MASKLSEENLEKHDQTVGTSNRRTSVSNKDGSSDPSGHREHHTAALSHAHTRRMSRMEFHPGRRMSMMRRQSIAASSHKTGASAQIPVKLQNTYRLEPNDDEKFSSAVVQKTLYSILESFLDGEQYEPKKCTQLSQNLSEVIKSRVKELHFTRYKLVCNVSIGQNGGQSMQCASRCIWNTSTDTFAQASYKSTSLFAIATVYGVYFE